MNSTQLKALAKTIRLSQKPLRLSEPGRKFTTNHWSTLLPAAAGVFQGRRIGLTIQPLVPINEGAVSELPMKPLEIRRIGEVLALLPKTLPLAEEAWEEQTEEDEPEADQLKPYISIYRRSLGRLKEPLPWSLIVDLKGTDFGWHIDFKGRRFVEIWAGD